LGGWVRGVFSLEKLTSQRLVRVYRDFYWRMGIDPTKIRPSSEALLRRVLQGKGFPRVNTLVDVYNVVSMTNVVPIAAFDADRVVDGLRMRYAREGEEFQGIGLETPLKLSGRELVIQDGEKLVAIYPYRDAEKTKVTKNTSNVLLMVCGVPGVELEHLLKAAEDLEKAVKRFCGGFMKEKKVFTLGCCVV